MAEVLIDGMPTPQRIVARYQAPAPLEAGRARGVRVRRSGTALLASWRGVSAARGYGVVVRQRNGTARLLRLPRRRHRIRISGIPLTQGGSVTVRALGPLGDWGAPTSAAFRATRRPVSRLRAFKQLGRRRTA